MGRKVAFSLCNGRESDNFDQITGLKGFLHPLAPACGLCLPSLASPSTEGSDWPHRQVLGLGYMAVLLLCQEACL